jgi:hypothetical protein
MVAVSCTRAPDIARTQLLVTLQLCMGWATVIFDCEVGLMVDWFLLQPH